MKHSPPVPQTSSTPEKEIGSLYGVDFLGSACLINRLKYKGRGRPKKTEYMTVWEAQKQLNYLYNAYIDRLNSL